MFPDLIFKLARHLLWEASKRPEPMDLDVDSAAPEALLEAASLLESQGEWARAVELYRLAAERSPGDQDAVYARGCIERIEEKKALGQYAVPPQGLSGSNVGRCPRPDLDCRPDRTLTLKSKD